MWDFDYLSFLIGMTTSVVGIICLSLCIIAIVMSSNRKFKDKKKDTIEVYEEEDIDDDSSLESRYLFIEYYDDIIEFIADYLYREALSIDTSDISSLVNTIVSKLEAGECKNIYKQVLPKHNMLKKIVEEILSEQEDAIVSIVEDNIRKDRDIEYKRRAKAASDIDTVEKPNKILDAVDLFYKDE